MSIFSNISIRQRVYFTVGFMVLFFSVAIFFFSVLIDQLADYRSAEKQILNFQTNAAKLQVHEGAFFQTDLQSNAFYYDDFSQNTLAFNEQYETILKDLDEISRTFFSVSIPQDRYREVVVNLNEYHEVFFDITSRLREVGNRDYGLIHKLITVQDDVERIANYQIKIALVSERIENLKRFQLIFLETGDVSILDNYERKYNDLMAAVNAFPPSFFGGRNAKRNFQIRLREYYKWFVLVVEKQELIGNVKQSGLHLELYESRTRVHEGFAILQNKWAAQIEEKRSTMLYFALLFVTISAILFVVIYYFASISLIKPVRTLQKHANMLAKGQIPEKLEQTEIWEVNQIIASLNSFVDGLTAKIGFSKKLGDGDFNADLEVLSAFDTLGASLEEMRTKLVQANQENQKNREEENLRNWYSEGNQMISSVLRVHSGDLELLSRNIIRSLVSYLGAVQAGFYTFSEANEMLELVASYAYDREKFDSKNFKLGEGLIGTVAIEKELLYLEEVPEGYLELSSTFGFFQAASLAIVPLVVENELLGVIEVATFGKFEEKHIKLLSNVAKDIATSLASVKINQQTLDLLEDSKRQAVELKEKEKDVARNLADLEFAKEELKVKEKEAKALLASVDSGLIRLELDLKARVQGINRKLDLVLRTSDREFNGRLLVNFLPSITEAVFNVRWHKLIAENTFFDLQTVLKSKTKQIWSHLYFFPVYGKDNVMTRVQVIGFDLTAHKQKENEFQNMIDEVGSRCERLTLENVEKNKAVSNLEKDILMKEIDFQSLLIDKQKIQEQFNYVDTQHKKATKDVVLKDQREKFVRSRMDLVMSTLPLGVVIVSAQGYVTFANKQMAQMISRKSQTIVNKRFDETLFDFDPFKLKTNYGYDASLSKSSGVKLDARVTVVEFENAGQPERIIFVEDHTREKQRKKDFIVETDKQQNTISELRNQILKLEAEVSSLKDEN